MAATVLGVSYGLSGGVRWDESARVSYREFENVYFVQTDSDSDGTATVLAAPTLPTIGVFWKGGGDIDTQARCLSVDPREVGPRIWAVTCRWSTHRDAPTDQETSEEEAGTHPTDRTPEWSWSSRTIELLQVKDAVTGDPIVNSVGEPIICYRPVKIPVLTIKRYQYTFDPDEYKDYIDHTNVTTFWGAGPGLALMADIFDDPIQIEGENLREVKHVIEFNFTENDPASPGSGWKHHFRNTATKYKVYTSIPGSPLDHYEVFTAMGNPTTGDIDLDGLPVPDGDPPVYLDFSQFPTAEFNDLKLGPTVWS